MTLPLFDTPDPGPQTLPPGAVLLRGWARGQAAQWIEHVSAITAQAPLRVMQRPGGAPLSVAMPNCGAYGWVSDAQRYSYSATDPLSSQPTRIYYDFLRQALKVAPWDADPIYHSVRRPHLRQLSQAPLTQKFEHARS